MVWVRMKNHVDQEWDERIGRCVCLFAVLEQAKDNLAAVQNTYDFISGCAVAIYL